MPFFVALRFETTFNHVIGLIPAYSFSHRQKYGGFKQMLDLTWIQLTIIEWVLLSLVLLLSGLSVLCLRRISALESRLHKVQVAAQREIKMVNQGAIGIGRRFAMIEKNLKKSKNVASFDAPPAKQKTVKPFQEVVQSIQPLRPEPSLGAVKPRNGQSTRAEQALSAWINEHQTA